MAIRFNSEIINQKPYQITQLQETLKRLEESGESIINASIGDPKDDTPSIIRQAGIDAIESTTFSQYPSYIGKESLRNSIKMWAKNTYNLDVDNATQIIACNGSKEAVFSFPLLFDWVKNNCILSSSLAYPVYKMSANYLNIPFIELPINEFTGFLPDLDVIPEETLTKTQLFWFNSPHNPTTAIASYDYMAKLVALAEKYNFIICSDECYNDLYTHIPPTSILEFNSEHWVCFRSLSKRSHMTGYRSGAILSKNKTLMAYLKKLRSPMGIGTPSFIQDAATVAWSDENHSNLHRDLYNTKRSLIKNALNNNGFQTFGGDAGFYIWTKHPDFNTSEALSEWFLNKGILVTPGTIFGKDGNPYIRLVFCLKDDELKDMINRIQH